MNKSSCSFPQEALGAVANLVNDFSN